MDCACASTMSEEGALDLYKKIEPVARKEHYCIECIRKIEKGEQYTKESGTAEGMWFTYHTCQDCMSIRHAFFSCGFTFEFLLEDMVNHVNEMDGQIKGEAIKSLTPRAREMVLTMIDNYIKDDE